MSLLGHLHEVKQEETDSGEGLCAFGCGANYFSVSQSSYGVPNGCAEQEALEELTLRCAHRV